MLTKKKLTFAIAWNLYICYIFHMKAIDRAAQVVGSQKKLADLLKVTPAAISHWSTGFRSIPAERCPDIERISGGKVRCEDLRPDINWGVLRGGS